MRACQRCHGPIQEERRADAIYCSTSCKLKAQRRRKNAAVLRATAQRSAAHTPLAAPRPSAPVPIETACSEERPWVVFSPVGPLDHAQQLAFVFATDEQPPRDDFHTSNTPDAHGGPHQSPPPSAQPSPAPSWIAAFRERKLPPAPVVAFSLADSPDMARVRAVISAMLAGRATGKR